MAQRSLHQFLTGASVADALTTHAFIIRRWLRDMGLEAEIYAQHIDPAVEGEVRHLSRFRRASAGQWAIYHHSIGSDVPGFLAERPLQLVLVYHNVTPPSFFQRSDPLRAELARLGRRQLIGLRGQTGLALAVSAYNELELQEAGYVDTAVLPLPLQPSRYDLSSNGPLAARLAKHTPRLLFVGRLAPNKKQEDLLKLLYYYRRIEPHAHLYLVGDRWEIGYDKWIESFARELHIQDGLTLTGKVSQQDLVTFYRSADLFVSMSEHEGFGLPLIESMYCSLPILAYGVTGVPYTLEDAGVQFFKKDFEAVAELVDYLIQDEALRGRVIARQKERVQAFLEPAIRAQFERLLQQTGIL